MEQVIINKASGDKIYLFSNTAVSGPNKAEQVCELLGQDVVNITMESAVPLPFSIGDYLEVFGSRYYMNALPEIRKVNDRLFQYEIRLEGIQYQLIKVQYLDIDSAGFSTGTSFALMGDMEDFAKLIIRNAERVYGPGSWVLGDCPTDTEVKNLSFDNETCLQALQKLCGPDVYDQQFDIERLSVDTYKLHIRKLTTILPDTFRYGRAKGLYALERNTVSNKNIVTRLFAYGSDRNIPPTYRQGCPRLKMPITAIYGEGEPFIEDPVAEQEYGQIEGSVIFDEVYPHRVGVVSAISSDPLVFYDNSMPFDLNAVDASGNSLYLLPGLDAKIKFNTGDLAGYEFTLNSINGYNHSLRQFTLIPYTDSRGMVFPSVAPITAFRAQVGDEYVITDITLPQAYIDDAEAELLAKAQQYLADNSKPRVQYGLTVNANYIASKAPDSNTIINYFVLAYSLKVQDPDMGLNGNVQIIGFTRNILKHYEYQLTLGESILQKVSKTKKSLSSLGGSSSQHPNTSSLNIATTNIINKLNSNILSLTNLYKTTNSQGSGQGASSAQAKYYKVTSATTVFYHSDLQNASILFVERGNIFETNFYQRNDWRLIFPDGLLKDEVICIGFVKNATTAGTAELEDVPLNQQAAMIQELVQKTLPVTEPFIVTEDTTELYYPLLENTTVLVIQRNGVFATFAQNQSTWRLTFSESLSKDEVLYITYRKNIDSVLPDTLLGSTIRDAIEQTLTVIKPYTISEDTTDFYHSDIDNSVILLILRNNLPETNFTQSQESWHLLFPCGLFAEETIRIMFRKNLS